jgi:hypothetical protein
VAQVQSDRNVHRTRDHREPDPHACRQRCVLHFAYQVGLSPEVLESENIVIFRCFDPVWGRGATVEQGLYDSVHNSMELTGIFSKC